MVQSKTTKNVPPSQDGEQSIRAILAISAVLIAVLSLILYGITREPALLIASGLAGVALSNVYLYYFKAQRQR